MEIENKDRVGLAVMDAQTLHVGHVRLLLHMISTVPRPIVGIGSVKKAGVEGHPFDFNQRVQMIETIFPQVFRFIPLDDIDASIDTDAWCAYVLKKVAAVGLPAPTDYFSGSRIDAKWYEGHFAAPSVAAGARLRTTATSTVFEDEATGRRVHIVDREQSGFPSGRDIRFLIEKRDPEWMSYVPERLHGFVEWQYPPHLRQALRGTRPPDAKACPVGTRFSLCHHADQRLVVETLELKDDGEWRPLSGAGDEKARHSRERHGKQ